MLQLEAGCSPVVAAVGWAAVHMFVGILLTVRVASLSSSVVAEVVALLLLLLPLLLLVPKQVEAVLLLSVCSDYQVGVLSFR